MNNKTIIKEKKVVNLIVKGFALLLTCGTRSS
jgi:hypothetical protein